MSRRGAAPKREVLPDPVYKSQLVSKFINSVMQHGKKSTAEGLFYGAMDLISQRTGDDPVKVFKAAMDAVRPHVEVKSRRVGGSTYQVPVEVSPARQTSLAIRWLIKFATSRHERTMTEKLAGEFLDAASGRGGAVKKKDDTHRMADANKAFAHYRW